MRPLLFTILALLTVPSVGAEHGQGCVPTRADSATYNMVRTLDGRLFYVEERGTGLPPVPLTGHLVGEGTWVYEETFAIMAPDGSLQRGYSGWGGCWPSEPPLCILPDDDPITDENCGHGPDAIII